MKYIEEENDTVIGAAGYRMYGRMQIDDWVSKIYGEG